MSSRNLSDTKPIPIKYTKSYHGFNDPSKPEKKYLFCLELGLNSKSIKNFTKIEDNKYSYMIDIEDNINYGEMINFNVFVSELPFNGQSFSMNGVINHSLSNFTQKDENFYIEFSQNNTGNTICTCYFTGVDFNTMFVSPPN